jgi:hypothetical protein
MSYIDFNNELVPIGKRKQAYVKWAIKNGTDMLAAKRQANNKFGFEKKPGIFAIVTDYGRTGMYSYGGVSEIFMNHDLRKYKEYKWMFRTNNEKEIEKRTKQYLQMGWKVINVELTD